MSGLKTQRAVSMAAVGSGKGQGLPTGQHPAALCVPKHCTTKGKRPTRGSIYHKHVGRVQVGRGARTRQSCHSEQSTGEQAPTRTSARPLFAQSLHQELPDRPPEDAPRDGHRATSQDAGPSADMRKHWKRSGFQQRRAGSVIAQEHSAACRALQTVTDGRLSR